MNEKKIPWIYQLRGLAIIAVVVCHQQNLLHTSENIQMLTLYSVTTLIFLMGVTEALSLKEKRTGYFNDRSISFYYIEKLKKILLPYIFATMAYLSIANLWTGVQLDVLFTHLLNFSASGPFYFIRYYICFTLLSIPIFILIIRISWLKSCKLILYAMCLMGSFVLGYETIGKLDFFGASYLSVYVLGIIWAIEDFKLGNIFFCRLFGIICIVYGFFSSRRFYFNMINGKALMGIDSFFPKLGLNPPVLSIIIYSIGIIVVGYNIFVKMNNLIGEGKLAFIPKIFKIIGKYSLDIFLWHLFIQQLLIRNFEINNIIARNIIYYLAMFIIPIIVRNMYVKMKNRMYSILKIQL